MISDSEIRCMDNIGLSDISKKLILDIPKKRFLINSKKNKKTTNNLNVKIFFLKRTKNMKFLKVS